jgi:streptomycin 3"-adenylyltransferase
LPIKHKGVMARARSICIGEQAEYWEDIMPQVHRCADYMGAKMRERLDLLRSDRNLAKRTILKAADLY